MAGAVDDTPGVRLLERIPVSSAANCPALAGGIVRIHGEAAAIRPLKPLYRPSIPWKLWPGLVWWDDAPERMRARMHYRAMAA